MTAGGLGDMLSSATRASDRSLPSPVNLQQSCLGSWFLEGEFASQRQVRMPCLASGMRALYPNPPLVGWPRHLPGPQLYHHRLWPKEEGYCSFPNSVIHREDEDRHLMLTKISNRNGIKPNLFSQRPILHPPSA